MKTLRILSSFTLIFLISAAIAVHAETPLDFDGDGKTDFGIFRYDMVGPNPSPPLEWWITRSSDNSLFYTQFGLGYSFASPGSIGPDVATPADFDGDGKTDISIWRRSVLAGMSAYYILNSSDSTVRIENFGQSGDDMTAVGDYDGDGKADLGLYRKDSSRPKNNYFIYRKSLNNPTGISTWVRIGSGSGSKRYPGDFDGDGKLDFCIRSGGRFTLSRSSDGGDEYIYWGLSTDRPVSGDVDGDGRTDFTVVRDVAGRWAWFILERDGGGTGNVPIIWGQTSPETESPFGGGDYDGDGKSDIGVLGYSGPNKMFRVRRSSNRSLLEYRWGLSGDISLVPSY